jgi:hypothetical protein
VELEEIPIYELLGASNLRAHLTSQPLGTPTTLTGVMPPAVSEAKAGRWVHYVEQEDGKAEVTAMCRQYLDYLEKLVREFLMAHEHSP